ncbi:phosphodiesterase [Phycisphaerae bacterium RAS1]|nr:phosphodiesterase [Phycisphaerae bacterium RAS1]
MILGVLSDSHGRVDRVETALKLLDEKGATALVHCGDIGDERVFEALSGRRAWFVWGNCDIPDPALARYAASLGLTAPTGAPTFIEADGKQIAVFHGHESAFERLVAELERGGDGSAALGRSIHYLLHGHTHVAKDVRVGRVRIVNPGALKRAAAYTVATLDAAADVVRHWVIE